MQKLKIRIIVGGPPNSGKSTFSASLVTTLKKHGTDAESIDLDLWSPTLDYIRGHITKEQRDEQKRSSIPPNKIEEICNEFKNASDEHYIVVGDAPGGISEELKQISSVATHGIVVCRDDKAEQIKTWKDFFKSVGVDTVATVISKTNSVEEIVSHEPLEIILSDLNRETRTTMIIKNFALLVEQRLRV